MFEITNIAAKDTFTLELLDGNEEPLRDADGKPLSVTVYGPGSKAYQRVSAARQQRVIDSMVKRGKVKMSAEEQQRETAAFLAACTVSFNGWAYKGDATAFEAAYLDPTIGFISKQVEKAIENWGNFIKA